jgi:hypothetical protein
MDLISNRAAHKKTPAMSRASLGKSAADAAFANRRYLFLIAFAAFTRPNPVYLFCFCGVSALTLPL